MMVNFNPFRLLLAISLLCLFFIASPIYAADNSDSHPFQLNANITQASLSGYIDVYIDKSDSYTFEQVQHANFSPQPAFKSEGYSPYAFWYRFRVITDEELKKHFLLSLGEPYLDDVLVWKLTAEGSIERFYFGDHNPKKTHSLHDTHFTLPLDFSNSKAVTFYVKVKSSSVINFNAQIVKLDHFLSSGTLKNLLNGYFFGAIAMISFVFCFFGIWLRNAGMLLYVGYLVCISSLFIGLHGYTLVLFPNAYSWLADLFVGLGVIGATAFLVLMWPFLLNYKKYFPKLFAIYITLGITSLCTLPFVVTPYYSVIAPISNYLLIAILIVTLTTQLILLHRFKQLEMALYILADMALMAGIVLQISAVLGFISPILLPLNTLQIATLIHVILISIVLVIKIRKIQVDKIIAEQEVVQSEQRRQEERRFVAMLSHEFRNPLASIDRSAQMIQIKSPELDAAGHKRLNNIRCSSSTLSMLVDGFLMSEAFESKGLVLNIKQHSLPRLLEDVIETAAGIDRERVKLTIIPEAAVFDLDKNMMNIAIGNLISNALRYSPLNSPVDVLISIDVTAGLLVQIRDYGSGLTDAELEQLGEPYYRAAASQDKKGSGLGYHFSRLITEAHGGTLHASSAENNGLLVQLKIPVSGV